MCSVEVDDFVESVIKGKRPDIPKSWPLVLASIVKDCLLKDPDDRPTMDLVNRKLRDLLQYIQEGNQEFQWPPKDSDAVPFLPGQKKSQIIFEDKPLHELSSEEVGKWLFSLNLGEHVDRFGQAAVDG